MSQLTKKRKCTFKPISSELIKLSNNNNLLTNPLLLRQLEQNILNKLTISYKKKDITLLYSQNNTILDSGTDNQIYYSTYSNICQELTKNNQSNNNQHITRESKKKYLRKNEIRMKKFYNIILYSYYLMIAKVGPKIYNFGFNQQNNFITVMQRYSGNLIHYLKFIQKNPSEQLIIKYKMIAKRIYDIICIVVNKLQLINVDIKPLNTLVNYSTNEIVFTDFDHNFTHSVNFKKPKITNEIHIQLLLLLYNCHIIKSNNNELANEIKEFMNIELLALCIQKYELNETLLFMIRHYFREQNIQTFLDFARYASNYELTTNYSTNQYDNTIFPTLDNELIILTNL